MRMQAYPFWEFLAWLFSRRLQPNRSYSARLPPRKKFDNNKDENFKNALLNKSSLFSPNSKTYHIFNYEPLTFLFSF